MRAFDTVIVGMGCAGLKCADELYRLGRRDIAIIVDDALDGTSRNAGSDKQTYYKLTLSGSDGDSVGQLARDLFNGGAVDGPNALCEAALSAKCFLRLCDLGVPFPMNRYGEYIGYRTDHDPKRRATSAGPLTSKNMTEALEKNVRGKGVKILDDKMAVKILVKDGAVKGVICFEEKTGAFQTVLCNHLVWATGGPADIYKNVSYPVKHSGMSGAAFLAGCAGANLTEWQYGLGSVSPRWNVSGTYMQVLPRFVSTDRNGNDEREFLLPGFKDKGDMLTSVFLKGYQWPFDARKAKDGSSRVDLMVQAEIRSGRRVFLDFRKNPIEEQFDFNCLSDEAFSYLESAGALLETPIQRLDHMNRPAIEFYQSHGVDLHTEMLEIALCAQHMNGGLSVNEWWETDIKNLYAVGEVAGTHGVYRPGGSALNAGQVGATRAAAKIARTPETQAEKIDTREETEALESFMAKCLSNYSNIGAIRDEEALQMSRVAAAVREKTEIQPLIERTEKLTQEFTETVRIQDKSEIPALFRLYDALIARRMVLYAISDYMNRGGVNRGSGLYTENGVPVYSDQPDENFHKIQTVRMTDKKIEISIREVKPIPEEDDFFENVWRDFREHKW